MSQAQAGGERATRRSFTTMAAFALGVPLAAAVLIPAHLGHLGAEAQRYTGHPVEKVEVVLFFCAMAALLAKLWASLGERDACRSTLLPPWDGKPVPAAAAATLRAALDDPTGRRRDTMLGRRVAAVLDFVTGRGNADDLDDQLRTLADNDAMTQEGSYALIRFITWAIPILGFLGTVLGITEAIAGVTPEVLEQSLSSVTDGLALAFDTTALALGLTMVVMFLSFIVERAEQGVLAEVDRYADEQLAHRFERSAPAGGDIAAGLTRNPQVLLRATETLVQRQAELWAASMAQSQRQWEAAGREQQERLTQALETALDRTLERHQERLAALEQQSQAQTVGLLEQLTALAGQLAAQTQAVAQMQADEKQLIRLQETLQQNLQTLAGAGAFEQMLHSLTGALHLLTARLGGVSPGNRLGPRNVA